MDKVTLLIIEEAKIFSFFSSISLELKVLPLTLGLEEIEAEL